jgi:hypothetical protein
MAARKPGDAPADTAPADAPPADAIADRGAQDHEQADIETGGEPQPGLYPADDLPRRAGTPSAKDGGERNEKRGKPTARDAAGNKQPGYAEKGEA